MTVRVSARARLTGLVIERDQGPLPEEAWNAAVPVDPGKLRIRVSAPDHEPRTIELTVPPGPASVEVDVPRLSRRASPAKRDEGAAPRPDAASAPGQNGRAAPGAPLLGYALGGAGIALLGVGAGFGLAAKSKWDAARERCPEDGERCDSEGVELGDRARTLANVSSVAFGAGAVTLGVGLVIVLSAPSADNAQRAPQIGVRLARERPMLVVGSSF